MKKLLRLIEITVAILSLVNCKTDINFMLDDYNSYYKKPDNSINSTSPKPGEDNFHQEDMLFDIYTVYNDGTLNLSAPPNCRSIHWTMYDPEAKDGEGEPISATLMRGFSETTQRYVFYTPLSGLEVGRTYQLQLKVTGQNDLVYKDTCEIAIVKTYHTTTGSRSVFSDTTSNTSISRTIIPSAYTINGLQYWIYYKDTEDPLDTGRYRQLTVEEINSSTGETYLYLPRANFELILYALQGNPSSTSSIPTEAVLTGKATADLRYTRDVSFVLSATDTTAVGQLKLKLYTKDWDINDFDSSSVTAKLIDSENKTLAYSDIPVVITQLSKENITANTIPSTYNYNVGLKPGTYTFCVLFTYKNITYQWSDNVIILGSKVTEETIGIPLVISDKEDSS